MLHSITASIVRYILRLYSIIILPDLNNAGSRISTRLVAAITLISLVELNPSNWFNNSNIVRCTYQKMNTRLISVLEMKNLTQHFTSLSPAFSLSNLCKKRNYSASYNYSIFIFSITKLE